MIQYVSRMLLALCLLTAFGAVAAQAQIESDVTIEASIPYSFIAGNTTLPAGKYAIKALDDEPGVLEIRSADNRTAVFVETESAQANQPPGKSELVFNKVGDKYFLAQVWLEGDPDGNQIAKSRMEKKLEAGGVSAERQTVALVKKHGKGNKKAF